MYIISYKITFCTFNFAFPPSIPIFTTLSMFNLVLHVLKISVHYSGYYPDFLLL